MLEPLTEALTFYGDTSAWLYLLIGTVWGLFVGAIPGIGSAFAMVIILPFTFTMSLVNSVIILISTYTAAIYGGSISACLLSIPGTGGNIVTTFDGYPMTQQGKAGLALGGSAIGSEIGNILSCLFFIFVIPFFTKFALQFGPNEMFMLALWGFVVSIIISPGNKFKNTIAGIIGGVLSCIGIDPRYGIPRLTFGSARLLQGVSLVPAILGVFAITVILQSVVGEKDLMSVVRQKTPKLSGFKELFDKWIVIVLLGSAAIGFLLGAIPGTGSIVACLIAYAIFKGISPHRNEYGKGSYEGVLVAETTNNATHPGAILTTMVLGIPGEMVMVILLGAFVLQGVQAGPVFAATHQEYLYLVFITIMMAGALIFALAWTSLRFWVRIIQIPKAFLWPIIILTCAVGAYTIRFSINDFLMMMAFGVFGFFAEEHGFSKVPLIMGLVLTPIMESHLQVGLMQGPVHLFFTKPIVIALWVILISTCVLFLRVLRPKRE
ncbi:MAG: tripartite tricarboxylate transporter permease [Chloroflexota bacterium]